MGESKLLNLAKILENITQTTTHLLQSDAPEYDRIILMGAHGTGKTTLANALAEELGLPVVESVAREFFKNWKYLEDAKILDKRMPGSAQIEVKQNILCSLSSWDFMRWVHAEVPVIMTRCPLDTLAYGYADDNVRDSIMRDNLNTLKTDPLFMDAIKKSLFVYLPIEFDIENDGVRPIDKKYQKDVDDYMRAFMCYFGIAPIVVTGSVEERCQQVLDRLICDNTKDPVENH